ncbi:hypothetical protein C9374_002322 [Naegleria lovaniensis]|uniref:Uncharacterized protein n=1 Tax=Naegleria lovaniensis TaxID=51637 RepID=A0AA88GV74_NAELO|nr:uncharacterized protein C9374_002322 [Naegleria lovaniensis]KAG2386578.1 hypothetical protein C9374_002322 [Naegleria lovaniensis]
MSTTTENLPSSSTEPSSDQQQVSLHYDATLDEEEEPLMKTASKQQVDQYFQKHKIPQIIKQRLNEAFNLNHQDPVEYLFSTKRMHQLELLLQQQEKELKELTKKHDEELTALQQSKEASREAFIEQEKQYLEQIEQLKKERKELEDKIQQHEQKKKFADENRKYNIELLKERNASLQKENATLKEQNQQHEKELKQREKQIRKIIKPSHVSSDSISSLASVSTPTLE